MTVRYFQSNEDPNDGELHGGFRHHEAIAAQEAERVKVAKERPDDSHTRGSIVGVIVRLDNGETKTIGVEPEPFWLEDHMVISDAAVSYSRMRLIMKEGSDD